MTEWEHSRRDEPRLGCSCRGCYETRHEHVEADLRELWQHEREDKGLTVAVVHQFLQLYFHGAMTYQEMKTKLILELWQRQNSYLQQLIELRALEPLTIKKDQA